MKTYKLKKITKILFSTLKRQGSFKSSSFDVLCVCHDNNLGVVEGGGYYSPLLHTVQEELIREGVSCDILAAPGSIIDDRLVRYNFVKFNRRYYFARLRNYFSRLLFKKNNYIVSEYVNLVRNKKIKLVLSIGSSPEFCNACKIADVYFIEILHGIGYTGIKWGYDKRSCNQLPYAILCMDDVSKRSFEKLKTVYVFRVANPFISNFINSNSNQVLNVIGELKSRKSILVSLQWGYDGAINHLNGILDNHILPNELVDLIEKNKLPDIDWHFRLHPVQLRSGDSDKVINFIENLCSKNKFTQWKWATNNSIAEVLIKCDGHITMSSMTSYEASYFGLRTLALCPTLQLGGVNEDMFTDLLERGYLDKGLIRQDVIENWISNLHKVSINNDYDNSESASQYIINLLSEKYPEFTGVLS